MAATYEFTLDITVDGKAYRAGETVSKEDVPAGSFQSMTRLKQLVLVKESPIEIPVEAVALSDPPKTKKSK